MTPFKQEEAYNPNNVDAQHERDLKAHRRAELKKEAEAGNERAKAMLKHAEERDEARRQEFNYRMDSMEECAMCAEGSCEEHGMAKGSNDEYVDITSKVDSLGTHMQNLLDKHDREQRDPKYKAKQNAKWQANLSKMQQKQGMAEGFPTVADAKKEHEKKEKEKGTGKFEKKTNRDTGGTIHTRKSSTFDNGGKDKDMKKAEKKSVQESMNQIQSRFLMEASFKRIAEEHGETLEEMMAQMAKDMEHYHKTGHCSHLLRDCMEIHWHNKQDVEETLNRPELADPWMGVKDAPTPVSTTPIAPQKPSFLDRAKAAGQKALSTLGHPDDAGMLADLKRKVHPVDPIDEELNQLAELAGLTIESKAQKPDFLDVDKDDDKEESFKKAVKDKQEDKVDEAKMDPVGKEDDDINNDGKKDKTDDYLKNRRAKIAQNIKEAEELVQMMKIAGLDTVKIEESIRVMEAEADEDECNECGMTMESCKCNHDKVEEAKIKVNDSGANPINAPKPEYKSMKASTLNPGEADSGEKNMYGGRGDNRMTQQPSRPVKPVKAMPTLESYIEAEYESIKKTTK
jgi:ferredoxin